VQPPRQVLPTTIHLVRINEIKEVHVSEDTTTKEKASTKKEKENPGCGGLKNVDIFGWELSILRNYDPLFTKIVEQEYNVQ
jgi:hypothetical protein